MNYKTNKKHEQLVYIRFLHVCIKIVANVGVKELLFNKRLLQTHLNSFGFPKEFDFGRVEGIIQNWQMAIKDGNYDRTKETQVQASFLHYFFNIILGYAEMQDNPNEWYLINEAKTELDGTKADGALGYFTKDEKSNVTRAVIELKDAKTPLDKKQSSRKDYDSPVSQAFSYSSKFDRCDWIIVSNFKEIRLYNKERGQGYFESFEILNLHDENEFKRFYFLLCKQNLLDKNRSSLLDNLVKDTTKNEEEISKQFYKDFKSLRLDLFHHICDNNPDADKKCLLEKTQKLLDRLTFIMFCEDSPNLLPDNTLKNYYDTGKNLPISSDTKIWEIIKGLFHSIDKGNNDIKPPINRYNGGLFAVDEMLDNLVIKDSIWEKITNISSKYDFESDLNVNILGHIFEQSLNDLEQIKAEIDGVEEDKTKSKRKKDGIFYTPEYITRYIVEQTIGKYLEGNPDKIETIKILDPACGSGAFLNQAHSFLREQYQIITEEKIDAERSSNRGGQKFLQTNLLKHTNIAETDRSILLNNIFGVDLNEESTEITKLALWLKTARTDQPLQNLDNNIKCGNSLIDDESIAGYKAFNWNEQFKGIMDKGGFDCIIGNPPYFNIDTFGFGSPIFDYLKNCYSDIYMDKSDILFYFIKKAIDLLKDNGILGFIISNAFLFSDKAKKLRNYILEQSTILEIVNFEQYYVFKDAGITSCILILQKNGDKSKTKTFSFKEKQYTEDFILNIINTKSNFFDVGFQTNMPFALVNNQIVNVNDKIDSNHSKLGKILHVGSGMQTAANEVFSFEECPKQFPKEFIRNRMSGEIIFRYYLHTPLEYLLYFENIDNFDELPISIQEYLRLNENILLDRATVKNEGRAWWRYSRPMHKEYYHFDKIWCSYRSKNNEFVYEDTKQFIGLTNTTVIFGNNENYNLKYILALLNSKTLNFRYKSIGKQTGSGIFEYFENQISKLPIPEIDLYKQASFVNKSEQMIELNKQLHEGVKSALELLQAEYKPKKISQNLEKFYTLGAHPFIEELQKQGVKLSLSQKEELLAWYKQKSDTLNNIKTQIDTLDHTIDQEVYKLYNLTEDEIKIIEGG